MGLSLEFYAGDAAVIGEDFSAVEFEGLRDGTRALAYADFSLEVSADDLDLLSEAVAERLGAEPLPLSECLVEPVGEIDEEGVADLVDPTWVAMIAGLEEGAAAELTADWFKRIGDSRGEPVKPTAPNVAAVRSLIRLCKVAASRGADVVHAWYL